MRVFNNGLLLLTFWYPYFSSSTFDFALLHQPRDHASGSLLPLFLPFCSSPLPVWVSSLLEHASSIIQAIFHDLSPLRVFCFIFSVESLPLLHPLSTPIFTAVRFSSLSYRHKVPSFSSGFSYFCSYLRTCFSFLCISLFYISCYLALGWPTK